MFSLKQTLCQVFLTFFSEKCKACQNGAVQEMIVQTSTLSASFPHIRKYCNTNEDE